MGGGDANGMRFKRVYAKEIRDGFVGNARGAGAFGNDLNVSLLQNYVFVDLNKHHNMLCHRSRKTVKYMGENTVQNCIDVFITCKYSRFELDGNCYSYVCRTFGNLC